MVNDKHKLLFVHISKTGGVSMTHYLRQIGGIKHHKRATTLKQNLYFNSEYQKQ